MTVADRRFSWRSGGRSLFQHTTRILELEAEQAKAENSSLSPTTIEDAIDEALEWARHA